MNTNLGFYWSPVEENLQEQLDLLVYSGANAVYIPQRRLSRLLLDQLHELGLHIHVDRGLFAGEDVRRQFPDSVPIDAAGMPFERDGWYVPACPNHPQLRYHHLQAIGALLDQHGHEIDSLWLDFIRFPVRWEGSQPELRPLCFCRHCLNNFLGAERQNYSKEETEVLARSILQERQAEWVEWKCRRIADFVGQIRAQITRRNLPLRLGIFTLPWRRFDFDGAMRSIVGQELELLAAHVDVFSPMVYHKLCEQPVEWIADVTHDHAAWSRKATLPIIQSVHRPDVMTPAQLDAALTEALNASQEGAMIFTLEPLLESRELAAVVRHHFGAK
jgi:hypothetical protein